MQRKDDLECPSEIQKDFYGDFDIQETGFSARTKCELLYIFMNW